MFKTKNIVLLFLFGIILSLFGVDDVSAYSTVSDFSRVEVPNVFYERVRPNYYFSYKYNGYDLSGKTAYCIEPAIDITETTYYGTSDLSMSGLSSETLRKVFLYAYYGYGYEGHDSVDYRIATQTLIWEEVSTFEFVYNTERYGAGTPLDYSKEMNEIINLVNNHDLRPSFSSSTIEVQVGEIVTLTDNNNVLSRFEVLGDNIANVVINGNQLSFTAETTGDITLNFKKKTDTDLVQLIHYNNDTQKMITRSAVDPVYFYVKLDSHAGQVEFDKLDKDTNSSIPSGEATLVGAEYGIYDLSGNLIEKLITDENGYAISEMLPYFGEYYIQEIKAPNGYTLDETKYYFESTKDNLVVSLDLYDKVIERNFEFTKVYADANTGIMTPEPNVEFGFYNDKNELVETKTTDKNGRIEITLPYGDYIVRQLTTTTNYEKVEDFNLSVTTSGEDVHYVISNAEITGKLKVVKVDEDTGDRLAISNITFKIFDITRNEYVCQKVTYPTTQTLCEFKTDENGELITPYPLQNGEYRLEEVDQLLDGYLWNSDPIVFEIGENSDFIKTEYGTILEVEFSNKEVKGQIEIEKDGEKVIIENGTFEYVEIDLKNVKFGLYANEDIYSGTGKLMYSKDESIIKATTDKEGYLLISDLYLGKYYLKELKTNDDHVLSDEKIEFELTYKDQYTPVIKYEVEVDNYLKKGSLEFSKTDLVTGDVIPNTLIEIYTENDELIFTGLTDKDGKIIIDNLFVGKFYIVEKEPATGYVITDEIVYFEILENGEVVKAEMKNKPITGTLEFTKVDFSTSDALPNTTIEIYNDKDELIFTGVTDENGMLIIENLQYGKYYILEKNAPEGYILSDEKMYFEILEDGSVIKTTMTNEKIPVPDTGINDIQILNVIAWIFIGAGVVYLIYVKFRKK